jgi:signal transduction histidine kinase
MKILQLKFIPAQILFWSIFTMYLTLPEYFSGYDETNYFIDSLLTFGCGIILSSGYHYTLKRIQFDYTSSVKIVTAIFFGSLITLFIYTAITYAIYWDKIIAETKRNQVSNIAFFISSSVGAIVVVIPWYLCYHLVVFIRIYLQFEKNKLEAENALTKLQLTNVISKMNPHFLFNTLNTVKWLVNQNSSEARRAIDQLSDILRYNIQENDSMKTIGEELEIVQKYLTIEKMRFEDRLTYSFDIEKQVKTKKVIPFIMVNLVENAIKYSISKLEESCHIQIVVCESDSKINIRVSNTGRLNPTATVGIGLKSIEVLLKNQFKDDGSVNIIQKTDNLVEVTVNFPIYVA